MGVGDYYARKKAFLAANPGSVYPGSTEDQAIQRSRELESGAVELRSQIRRKDEVIAQKDAVIAELRATMSVNPDPTNYKVTRVEEICGYTVIQVNYPNCSNYEGEKLMVYPATVAQLLMQRELDPHFQQREDYHSPIARFVPSSKGWEMALALVRILADKRE